MIKDFNQQDVEEIFNALNYRAIADIPVLTNYDINTYKNILLKTKENYPLRKILSINNEAILLIGFELLNETSAHTWFIMKETSLRFEILRIHKDIMSLHKQLLNLKIIQNLYTLCYSKDLKAQKFLSSLNYKHIKSDIPYISLAKNYQVWRFENG